MLQIANGIPIFVFNNQRLNFVDAVITLPAEFILNDLSCACS